MELVAHVSHEHAQTTQVLAKESRVKVKRKFPSGENPSDDRKGGEGAAQDHTGASRSGARI